MSVIAFDLGAGSGRTLVGAMRDEQLVVREIHRFPNDPVQIGSRLHWDILRVFHEMKQGLLKAKLEGYDEIRSLAIDSWAVDFGLIGRNGELLGNPYHYRDAHTDGVMEEVFSTVDRSDIFSRTGIQFLPFNTIYQLAALQRDRSPLLEQGEALLMIPDLLRYFLTGEMKSEFTNATTTQLFNPLLMNWDEHLVHTLNLPAHLFQEVVQPGTTVGTLRSSFCKELDLPAIPVMATAEHDTGAAVAAVPANRQPFAYLSCGTWSLLGTEVNQPVLNEQALALNFTNEGGINRTFRLLKNIMGLWILEECKRSWAAKGQDYAYDELLLAAEQAEPFRSFIDPDDLMFLHPADMPAQVQSYCRRTGQTIPDGTGQVARCVLESLALKYRYVHERTEILSGQTFAGLHMVGGGIKNKMLCQMTANALGKPVWAGPEEASAIGNIAVQFIAAGIVQDIWQARALIRQSIELRTYEPEQVHIWNEAYQTFLERINRDY